MLADQLKIALSILFLRREYLKADIIGQWFGSRSFIISGPNGWISDELTKVLF